MSISHDLRKTPRKRVLRRARIVYAGGRGVVPCTVLDLSGGGARIKVGDWLGIPEHFELHIEDGPSRIARVCHRGLAGTGVRFEEEAPA